MSTSYCNSLFTNLQLIHVHFCHVSNLARYLSIYTCTVLQAPPTTCKHIEQKRKSKTLITPEQCNDITRTHCLHIEVMREKPNKETKEQRNKRTKEAKDSRNMLHTTHTNKNAFVFSYSYFIHIRKIHNGYQLSSCQPTHPMIP